jgi:hypothetical protein
MERYNMDFQIDTIVGNKKPSKELTRMLVDLHDTARNYFNDIEDRLEKIRVKAHSEHFSKQETVGLLKQYLKGSSLTDSQVKWFVYDKPRRLEQKKLKEKLSTSRIDANMLEETITLPTEHKILPQDLEEIIQEQQPQEQGHEQQDLAKSQVLDYAMEELEVQLEIVQKNFDQTIEDKKQLEEKYKQLEARTRVSPSNSIPAVQGNTLRTKIVVNQVFREMLQLKGSKMIYANIVIDTSQNKYVRLEPI